MFHCSHCSHLYFIWPSCHSIAMALRASRLIQLLVDTSHQQACYSSSVQVTKFDWKSLKLPDSTTKDIPTSTGGAAFKGDIRATSGLGKGDGCKDHTSKWLQVCFRGGRNRRICFSCTAIPAQGESKPPIVWIAEAEPIKVEGPVVASHGGQSGWPHGPYLCMALSSSASLAII